MPALDSVCLVRELSAKDAELLRIRTDLDAACRLIERQTEELKRLSDVRDVAKELLARAMVIHAYYCDTDLDCKDCALISKAKAILS